MLIGIGTDIGMVLYLQVTRGAVQKAAEFSLGFFAQCHILASTVALILYVPVLFLGFKLIRGGFSVRTKQVHVALATCALICRTMGFLLMFSMWKD